MNLNELADRVERASGAAFVLDREISDAMGHGSQLVRAYTGRLDVAATLVPEGWDWAVGTAGFGTGGHAFLRPAQAMTAAGSAITVDADTPALALVAASLRAKASMVVRTDA